MFPKHKPHCGEEFRAEGNNALSRAGRRVELPQDQRVTCSNSPEWLEVGVGDCETFLGTTWFGGAGGETPEENGHLLL